MDQYKNRDGVIVSAELLPDDAEEHAGFWHTVDANGVHGHVDDELFRRNFSLIEGSVPDAPAAPAKGKMK